MPGVSKEEIANARKMDLLSYLRAYEPGELVRFSGETYCTRTHDSLKISNGKWYWFSQNIGGRSALDYLVKVKEMSFPEAVKMLNGQAVQPICYEKPPPAPRKLLLPSLDTNTSKTEAYLKSRGIHPQIIAYCIQHGLLFQSESGNDVIFVGYDTKGTRRYAALRSMTTDYKGEATGSDKHFSFALVADDRPVREVHVFEAAIDAMCYYMVDVEKEDVVADPMRLNQIMLNILSNAIKFTPVGGMITLRIVQKQTAPHGSVDYEFHIRDTGIGMSSAFQEHIFEQFAREETSTVSKIQGTGLGMAITKNLVDMMGGRISVESEPGKGSEFTVSLRFPISGEQAVPQRIPQLEGLRALVADDDTNTCLNVSKMLRMIGMRSDWTTSGHEAVVRTQDAIEQGDGFDVFIIDWMIPDLNGLEVVRRIRRLIGSNTPIIILTAYDWADIEVEAKAAGVTAFCAKPLFISELRRILAEPFLPAEAAEQTEKKADFAGKRLLVVEDNALNREIAVTMLEEGGFEVDTAENGKVAVDKVRESAPGYYDLVLMDIQMPIMDGYAAARAIRALPNAEKAGLPIVAMTANAFDEDRQNAEKAGMNGHLSKPFDMQQLLTMLREKLSP